MDLHVVTKPDLTPVTDADKSVEEGIRRTLVAGPAPRRRATARRRARTGHGPRRWVVDPIDGTKNFVRGVPVWATLIALMVDGRGRRRRGVGTGAAATLVGLEGRRRLDRPVAALGQPSATSPTSRALDDASLSYSSLSRLGRTRPARRVHRADPAVLAHPGVRRLLVLHAGRRGRRRPRRRAGPRALRHGRARRHRREAGGTFTAPRRHARARTAATRWPPTAGCTSRRWRSSGRCPTTRTTRTRAPTRPRARCTTSAHASDGAPELDPDDDRARDDRAQRRSR